MHRPWHLGSAFAIALALAGCGDSGPAPVTAPPVAATTSTPAQGGTSRALRIMPLGDSITQGDSEHDTYRRPLWKTLESEGYAVDFVGSSQTNHRGDPPSSDFDRDHEGHWGWRVDEILERLDGWLDAHEPDVILVHLGSNDVFQGQSIGETVEELRSLIGIVRVARPEATILLAQIIPTAMPVANRGIRDLNARIAELAAEDVIIVDQFTGFDAASQTYDGVHPNPDGEIHLSDRWLGVLKELLTAL